MKQTDGRIVYISPYYDPKVYSGANRRFVELVRRFEEELGDKFTLIVAKGMIPPGWKGKNVYEIAYSFTHLSKFRALFEMSRILDRLEPSIVVCESLPVPFRSLKRHVHFQVAYDFRYFTGDSKGWLYRKVFSRFFRQQWGRSEFMVTCSDFSISELQKYVGYSQERVVKSFFGINEDVLEMVKTPPPDKDLDVIYVGHFEKRKNHRPLIHALALIDKNIRALFVGNDNGMQAELEILCQNLGLNNVRFGKLKTDAELWDAYRRSRVFAYPSLYEGFGIPLVEAIALDTPIACADIPVFHEVGGTFPLFFDPLNSADIAMKIRMILGRPPVMDRALVKQHLEHFLWTNIYKRFHDDLKAFAQKS